MHKNNVHKSVLLKESIDLLNIKKKGAYVDCTLGYAGHSLQLLNQLTNEGKLFCFEQDNLAIEYSQKILSKTKKKNFQIIHSNFKNLKSELALLKINKVDGILYDLGVSSPQIDNPRRGFSYHKEGNLDMRMDSERELTAHIIVNTYSLQELSEIFSKYGEEKYAYLIAKKIIKCRSIKEINTTLELVDIIKQALPSKILRKNKHPARKTFQALRIAVNNELNNLKISLSQSLSLLNNGGRIVVISFHSLEDKIVKKTFKNAIQDPNWKINSKLPIQSNWKPSFRIISKKVLKPSEEEILDNKRSRSAVLRCIEKIA